MISRISNLIQEANLQENKPSQEINKEDIEVHSQEEDKEAQLLEKKRTSSYRMSGKN